MKEESVRVKRGNHPSAADLGDEVRYLIFGLEVFFFFFFFFCEKDIFFKLGLLRNLVFWVDVS
jgi:hypothetical protein